MPQNAFEPSTVNRLIALEQRVRSLETAPALNAAAIKGPVQIQSPGSLRMLSASGVTIAYMGQRNLQDGSGRTEMATLFYRDDGTEAFAIADQGTVLNHTHQQAVQWFDRAGNVVFADDTVSGAGVARPHIPLGTMSDTNIATWYATSATTWTTIAEIYAEYQQPKILWQFQVQIPANVTGNFRLTADGAQIGATFTQAGGTGGVFATWADLQPWPSGRTVNSAYRLTLDAYISAGTGTIKAEQQFLSGSQS